MKLRLPEYTVGPADVGAAAEEDIDVYEGDSVIEDANVSVELGAVLNDEVVETAPGSETSLEDSGDSVPNFL